jgi:hypothetical protein
MMSRALDNRLPPPESGLEHAPWNTFGDEDWEEDDKGELGAVMRSQARRASPYTRPNQKDTAVTARRAESPPTDITDLNTEQDVAESIMSSHVNLNLDFL